MSGITLHTGRGYGKTLPVIDFVLDAVNAGESVLLGTSAPDTFGEQLQARAVERGVLVCSTREKHGVRVSRKL